LLRRAPATCFFALGVLAAAKVGNKSHLADVDQSERSTPPRPTPAHYHITSTLKMAEQGYDAVAFAAASANLPPGWDCKFDARTCRL
jgi:hypothetical protein